MHASMVLTRSREGHQGPWHAVLHAIAQGIACPCAVCMMIPRDHGMLFCMWCHDVASSRIPPSSLFPSWLEHPVSCKMRCYGMSFCVPAFLTRQRFSDPLIHPSAPRRGVERRLRERVMRPRIMQQAIRHKASSHIPVNPLLYQARASRVWYARFVAMACPFACLLFSHVNDSQTH